MCRLVLLALFPFFAALAGTPPIFVDGFEDAAGPPCLAGMAPGNTLEGDLGAASAAPDVIACLEIANDRSAPRTAEVAWAGIPIPRSLNLGDADLDSLRLIAPGNRLVAVQFDVLARWGAVVDDSTRPIRWLGVSAAVAVDAEATSRYALVRTTSGSPSDPFAASIQADGQRFRVDTGLARFMVDPTSPALITSIEVDLDDDGANLATVYTDQPGAGPHLTFVAAGGGDVVVDTAGSGTVVVDDFSIIERGPVKVVVKLNGHLVAPAGESLCDATSPPYERFGYTLVAIFERGSRDVFIQYQFRNECSNAGGEPWDDEGVTVREAGWRFPLGMATPTAHYAGQGAIVDRPGFSGEIMVRQRRGAVTPWVRRADVLVDDVAVMNAEFFESPLVALSDPDWAVVLQMPWMRFREPQALSVSESSIGFRAVTESLVVGEGKGIWNFALLQIQPAADTALEELRSFGQRRLERGLLLRPERSFLNQSGIFPGFGNSNASAVKSAYRGYMEGIHDNTVQKQWGSAKTYGSQIWPDIQFNEQFGGTVNATPAENNPTLNYWNPSGAELLEFLRSGEPRWVWDFALPQSWLQTFTAYLNIFDKRHGRSNGAAVNSGGSGEGHWHRNAFGSDDYTYNRGMALAYVLRPSPAMRQRFGHAGQMVIDRYNVPRSQQATRDFFLSRISPERGILQHFENLANCAEFVPGAQGQACHDKLMEVLGELALDNLRAGMICQGDVPDPGQCDWPQQFMINAMQYGFFLRMHLNYGDVLDTATAGPLARMLREMPRIYYDLGMDPPGSNPAPFAQWAALQSCTIVNDAPGTCQRFDTGDGVDIIFQNRPHTLALGMIAHWLDPSADLCVISRQLTDQLFDGTEPFGPLSGYLGEDSGWYKGSAQVAQQMVFVVGLYDTQCQ